VTATLFIDVFIFFERGWKVKKINRIDELLDVVVKISRLFCILQHDEVVKIVQRWIAIKGRKNDGGKRAGQSGAAQVFGLRQSSFVRNLQNAGGLCIAFNKKLQVHTSTGMQRYTKELWQL
jgi:hypothetical protein